MKWPEDPKSSVEIDKICEPLRHAFNQIVVLRRHANTLPIEWTGFDDIPSIAHMCVPPDKSFSDMRFRENRRCDGMDVLDIVIQLAVQLGIEQGRRLERRLGP